ncbi:hypothetical protein DMC25_00645 [Caulobacter sp. D4A]|uniref:hypothetical protein n=1 Tax=unclassified Caulobacter TaxID=2648921 RepID=UPI000D72FA49|nr:MULTISPECIES: hypothetical protein [unclassified Caulobacter]PXA94759.1 hypothetical protein DMC18_05600 [Caulobacter sp. D5]PXA95474.1 hypothetical protein DMC25_00645 [Caulobacter sp. D4A]
MAQKPKAASRSPASRPKASPKPAPAQETPALEWASAAVGLVLAATAISLTAWDALFGAKGPPAIAVTLVEVTPTAHGYVAQVEAFNHGGEPAAQVQIEGVLSSEGGQQTSGFTIDYVAEGSKASGGLVFEKDPRAGDLKLRATGFADAS